MAGQHLLLVDLHRQHFPQTCYGLNEWRQYVAPGVWHPVPEPLIRRALIALARGKELKATAPMISSALSLLQDEVYVPAGKFDSNPDVLAVTNGLLEIPTRTLRNYHPSDYVTSTLPYAYDSTATSELWQRAESQCPVECRPFMQEYAGYCLTPSTHHELAVWLYGPPGGGKSTFIDGIHTMLGSRCGVLGLDEIARSPFALTQVVGKTLLVCTEQPADIVKSSHILLRLISGEPQTINPKHQPAFEYRPHAKIMAAMNELPPVDSASVGLFRRVAPIHWPAVPENQRDPALKEQIGTQGPAILNYALDGLDRLRARGRFELPELIKEARIAYQARNDDVLTFIKECCTTDPEGRVQAAELHARYEVWCTLEGVPPKSMRKFAPEVDKQFNSVTPHRTKFWVGLALQPDESSVN